MSTNNSIIHTTYEASDLAEISGLRQQILGNGNILFFECSYLEVIVMTADYPESGWYGARLVDLGERSLLLGRQYAPSITAALRQLLQETCDSIRDNHILQNYTSA